MKIDLVILAAGYSSRFQGNKLLYPIRGKAMILHVIEAALPTGFHQIYVVTQYDEVINLAKQYPVTCIPNHMPERGISYSIQLGIQGATDADAVTFLTGDLPYLQTQTLQHLCNCADESHIICAMHHQIMQNPMLFPKRYFSELLELQGDMGGKKVALRHVDACIAINVNEAELRDIDTVSDLHIKKFS